MKKRQDLLSLSSELWWADGWPQSATQKTIGSGFEALDQELPAGGWPCGALSELLSKQIGIGELRLLIPVMRQLTLQQKTVMLMNPPMLPYGPALASHGVDMNHLILLKASDVFDRLWAIEQCLRSNSLLYPSLATPYRPAPYCIQAATARSTTIRRTKFCLSSDAGAHTSLRSSSSCIATTKTPTTPWFAYS
jgi:hypothetical protein